MRFLLASLAAFAAVTAATAANKPNVIVFLSDDVGYGEYGFQGNKEIPTPNIDAIARNGVRFPAGQTYDHPIIQLDILPTCVVAAGGKIDPAWQLEGVDLMPYLTGKVKDPPHESLYWRFGEQWAVRKGDWKLVASTPDGVRNVKLFNLRDDIGEANDQYAARPEKVKELKADWDKWNEKNIPPLWVPAKKKDKKDDRDDG